MAKHLTPIQIVRRITLGVLLVGLTTLTILHQKMQGIPSIDAVDPFGGLETLMKFIAGGELIKKIEPGNIVLFGGIVALGIVLSRFFCGWFCAFGALQGVFGWIGKKLFGRRFTVPAKLDRPLRLLKYAVLVVIIALTWWTGTLVVRPYEPLAAYAHLSAGLPAVWAEFAVGFVLLVLILVLSMLYERAFCKYLCPLGAFNAILARIPLFRIKREAATCISCAKCDKVCPMNVDVSSPDRIDSPECISCMECVTACPTKKGTLRATLGGKAVKTGTVVILGFALFALAALVGKGADMFHFVAPTLQSLADKGSLDVADIKGSSTYQAVADSFGIELERLYRESGVDPKAVPADTMLKDTGKLIGVADFEADTVRSAVARILGVPYAGEHGDLAPTTAPASAPAPAASGASETTALVVPPGFVLEGTMSIQDAANALGTTGAAVIEKLGLDADIPQDKPLRDMKDEYGYSMPALKEKIMQ